MKDPVKSTKRECRTIARWIAAGFVAGLMAAPALAAADVCSQTAKAAKRACKYEARDDFWIAMGKCRNLSAADDRRECESEAGEDLRAGRGECQEQYRARQELCRALGGGPYDPDIDPANFLDPSEIAADPNPLLPLVPGMEWVYEGGDETITVTVTDRTREILGVECVVVRDVVEEDGEVLEDTDDYLTQDVDGNVWYFGELSLTFEDGELVDIEGSWVAGVDGAKPGILMKAAPAVGDVYRQEFALGDAEDYGEVIDVTGSESVPAASCSGDCAIIRDSSALEPGMAEDKYYAPDIGLILEVDVETGARVELVEVTP